MITNTKLVRSDYTVGWLCAVEVELAVATEMLDIEHDDPYDGIPEDDENTYTYGSINNHNVVIACLPPNSPGLVSAAILVEPLARSFPQMKVHLFVGIGGGIPRSPSTTDAKQNIHLGDVVVGWPADTGAPAILKYDLRFRPQGSIADQQLLGLADKPDRRLLNALQKLLAKNRIGRIKFAEHLKDLDESFQHPGLENDRLYESSYEHGQKGPDCSGCDSKRLVKRPKREKKDFVFHRGTILSGNTFMGDSNLRDQIARKYDSALCIEMEAAGIIDQKHCLVIRGISDYADSHTNRKWQDYAAATAAAFAKQFLYTLQPRTLQTFETIQSTLPNTLVNKPKPREPTSSQRVFTLALPELPSQERIFQERETEYFYSR